MRISATGNPAPRDDGFTLVELLVVIAILAVASGFVMLTLPNTDRKLADDLVPVAARISLARDGAIASARPMAFRFDASGFMFEESRNARWQTAPGISQSTWPEGAALTVQTGGQVIFDATGFPQAEQAIELVRDGQRATLAIHSDGHVDVR